MTTHSYRPFGGHDELTRSDTPAEPLISAVRGGASLVLQPDFVTCGAGYWTGNGHRLMIMVCEDS